jgi:bifunctional DNA-binding transcriptional regulator/antitoxin component of YhaV-PrlF toxin-antitoxin module
MKLQKHFAYNYKGKNHYKSVIVIPDNVILKLGWKHGQELESEIEGDKLILKMKEPR